MSRITYDSSDDEEYDMEEDEAIAMLLIMHRNKRPKHDGSVFGREVIHRERMGQPLERKLLQNGTTGKWQPFRGPISTKQLPHQPILLPHNGAAVRDVLTT
jgi:hypothetical protein